MACGCYNSNEFFLPWGYPEDLTVHANEYNLSQVVNRGSIRLLENDALLERNYLCVSGSVGCCSQAYSLYATVSALSAEWTQLGAAVSGSVWSAYNLATAYRTIPAWSPTASGEVVRGFDVDAGSVSLRDTAIPTTRCAINAIANAVNPEFVGYLSTGAGPLPDPVADPTFAVFAAQNVVRQSTFSLSDVILGCAAGVPGSAVWPTSPGNVGYFCGATTDNTITLKSLKSFVTGTGSDAFSMLETETTSTNAILKVPAFVDTPDTAFDLAATLYVESTLDDLYLYTGNPTMKLRQDSFLRRIGTGGATQAGRLVTVKSDFLGVEWWLGEGKITYGGTEYDASGGALCFEPNPSPEIGQVSVYLNATCNKIYTEIKQYTVEFVTDPPEGGTLGGVTSQEVNYGEACTEVTATNAVGYTFSSWTASYTTPPTSPEFPYTDETDITVAGVLSDMTVTANFVTCCDAGIGDMTIADDAGAVPADACPFEVSPKGGCS